MNRGIPLRVLADELNVRVQLLRDLAHAGHVEIVDGKVTKDSADELRWRLVVHKHLMPKEEQ